MTTIASTAYEALAQGLSNEEVLAIIKTKHPEGHTTPACVAYYRSQAKKLKPAPAKTGRKTPAKVGLKSAEARKLLLNKLAQMESDVHNLRELIAAA